MRRRKKTVWAMVILAILIMSGAMFACGNDDDGNGVSTAECKDACNILDECYLLGVNEDVPPNLDGCYSFCDAGGFDADETAGIKCVNNNADNCEYIEWECFGD